MSAAGLCHVREIENAIRAQWRETTRRYLEYSTHRLQ